MADLRPDPSDIYAQVGALRGVRPEQLAVTHRIEGGDQTAGVPAGDGGASSGPYQIKLAALEDANKSAGTTYQPADLNDFRKSTDVAAIDLAELNKQLGDPVAAGVAYAMGLTGFRSAQASGSFSPQVIQRARLYATALGLPSDDASLAGHLGISNVKGFGPPNQMFGHMSMDQFTPYFRKLEQNQAESEKATAPIREKMLGQLGEDMDRAHKAADAIEPVDIQKWSLPPPKNDPVDGFASFGAMFAGIASAFTHTPAINAMNGMAAAIQARNEGNQIAYKQAYEAWKDNTQLAIDRQKIQSAAFTRALDLMQTDVAAGHAALIAAGSVYGDRNAVMNAELGLYGKVAEANAVADRAMMVWGVKQKQIDGGGTPGTPGYVTNQIFNQIKQEHPEMQDGDAWAEAVKRQKTAASPPTASKAKEDDAEALAASKFREVNGRDPDPNNQDDKAQLAKLRTDQRAGLSDRPLTEENADMQARFYLRTGQLPSGSRNKGAANQITQRAAEIAKEDGKSVDDYLSGRATLRADTASLGAVTKQKNAAEGYERGAVKSLDLMQSLIPKTPEPLDNQTLTRWARTGATEFGDVNVPQWQAALIIALDQYAKVISGATGAQGSTDSARGLALSLIPAGATSAQIPGIINVLKKDMDLKVQGYDTQINDIKRGIAYPDQNVATPVTGATPAKTDGGYSSADDVKRAYHDGKLSKDEAAKVLREKFGYQ